MNHVKDLRIAAGLTQTELAVAAGCKQSSISNIEQGGRPGIDLARAIVKALNCTGRVSTTLDAVFPAADQDRAA